MRRKFGRVSLATGIAAAACGVVLVSSPAPALDAGRADRHGDRLHGDHQHGRSPVLRRGRGALGGTAGVAYTVRVHARGSYGRDSAAVTTGTATPTLPLIPATPPTADALLSTTNGAISIATPGQTITFVGHGFAPHSSVRLTIYSAPKVLGEAVADATGAITTTVTVPPSLAAGAHTITCAGRPRRRLRTPRTQVSHKILAQHGTYLTATTLVNFGVTSR